MSNYRQDTINTSTDDQEMEILSRMAVLLGIGLDLRSLSILREMLKAGVNPESIVDGNRL